MWTKGLQTLNEPRIRVLLVLMSKWLGHLKRKSWWKRFQTCTHWVTSIFSWRSQIETSDILPLPFTSDGVWGGGTHKTISLLVLTAPEALLSLWKFLPGTQGSDEDNLDRVTSHLFPRMKILDKSILITLHLLWCVSAYQALGMHPMMRSFSNSMM